MTCVPALLALGVGAVAMPGVQIPVGVLTMLATGSVRPSRRMLARADDGGWQPDSITRRMAAVLIVLAVVAVAALVVVVVIAPEALAECLPIAVIPGLLIAAAVTGATVGAAIGHEERRNEATLIIAGQRAAAARWADETPAVPVDARDYLVRLVYDADREIEETAGAELADEVEAWLRDGAR